MPELVLHDCQIATMFDLLGHDENDMTESLGSRTAFRQRSFHELVLEARADALNTMA